MEDVVSLTGPVEKLNGHLVLLIPLDAGGCELVRCSLGIAEVEGQNLKVTIPGWLADKLGIHEGSTVHVDHRSGRFNIEPVRSEPKPN